MPRHPTRRGALQAAVTAVGGGLAAAARADAPHGRGVAADVCVYGGTASGVVAAVAAAQAGLRVVIVQPSRWLGGMTGGGLSHIDWGRREAVGGMAAELLAGDKTDAEHRQAFRRLVATHGIEVVYEHRLSGVSREGPRIRTITLDRAPPDRTGCPLAEPADKAAREVAAAVFIDCSYEGDLMAQAGVPFAWGRESTEEYGESLAGVRPDLAVYAIDPFIRPGDRSSGLLPLLQDLQPGPPGSADRLTMGYGFRYKFGIQGDLLPIEPPDDYDPRMFELYRRGFQRDVAMNVGRRMRQLGVHEPERGYVYNINAGNLSRCLLNQTVFGCNAGYPDGTWRERSRVWRFSQHFMRGVTHFLRTDPAVPESLRERARSVGFLPGPFDDTAGWPHQLYVREARRMKAAYVVTQKDLEGKTSPDDPVGLASYGVDDWPYATYARDGGVALSGGDFSMLYLDDVHRGIYRIPYRAITPPREACENLLVPVCASASHVAMTSIRMEPVWMILGESAGVAAALAIAARGPVQAVDYPTLRRALLARGQRLDRPAADSRSAG
jgi:hypothetical protein